MMIYFIWRYSTRYGDTVQDMAIQYKFMACWSRISFNHFFILRPYFVIVYKRIVFFTEFTMKWQDTESKTGQTFKKDSAKKIFSVLGRNNCVNRGIAGNDCGKMGNRRWETGGFLIWNRNKQQKWTKKRKKAWAFLTAWLEFMSVRWYWEWELYGFYLPWDWWLAECRVWRLR